MSGVEVKVTDRVTIQCPVPATEEQTREFSGRLDGYVSTGYAITGASEIDGGSQRDPYVVGLKITLERK